MRLVAGVDHGGDRIQAQPEQDGDEWGHVLTGGQ